MGTINQARDSVGLPPIPGGEVAPNILVVRHCDGDTDELLFTLQAIKDIGGRVVGFQRLMDQEWVVVGEVDCYDAHEALDGRVIALRDAAQGTVKRAVE